MISDLFLAISKFCKDVLRLNRKWVEDGKTKSECRYFAK